MLPTGNYVRVILGMGEAGCDFAGNIYHHYIYRFRDLVVGCEVGRVIDKLG